MATVSSREPLSIRDRAHEAVLAYRRGTGEDRLIAEEFVEEVVRRVLGLLVDELSMETTEAAEIGELASRDLGGDASVAAYDVHWQIALGVVSDILAGEHGTLATETMPARLDHLRRAMQARA
jgi:hypothetical protein